MIKFEEEAIKEAQKSKVIANYYDGESTASDIGLNIKLGRATHNFPWLEFAKNWHSDEEFQELLDKYSNLNDNYEKEVIRSSKLESQIIDLKSQLQQQALPVVPECVAEGIESIPRHYSAYGAISLIKDKIKTFPEGNEDWVPIYKWLFDDINNQDVFALAFITGNYQVEKPQLFYLREKNTNYYLNKSKNNGLELVLNPYFDEDNQFTQSEIDSMQTGSYEQIEVEK